MIAREQLRSATARFDSSALAALAVVLILALATPTLSAQTYTVLYTFQGQSDGGFPNPGLYRDSSGNLYGITTTAGNRSDCNNYGCGTVYKLTASGEFSVLHTFTGGVDGWPNATWGALIPDPTGNLYGVASIGGAGDNGVVFRITPSGTFTVLHTFPSGRNDGLGPQYSLLRDPATGLLYGTTFGGGNLGLDGYGTVFVLTRTAIGSDMVLHSFDLGDGAYPQGDIAYDGVANLYGTTGSGGTSDCGVVWKMRNTGAYAVLYNFTCAPDGYLAGSVVLDAQGNIYGGTSEGGDATACPFYGCGIIFKISPSGQETILHTFHNTDGASPNELMFDPQGNLWGTTAFGGTHDQGTIFKITTNGTFTDEYNFVGGMNGGVPYAGLVEDAEGNFYGTTGGGILRCIQSGCGMVYKFTPQ
jgi:uncharacterized repeat protein (TIGR03803 family)